MNEVPTKAPPTVVEGAKDRLARRIRDLPQLIKRRDEAIHAEIAAKEEADVCRQRAKSLHEECDDLIRFIRAHGLASQSNWLIDQGFLSAGEWAARNKSA